jgi:pyrimidine-nucleoside phosphorylase
MSLDVYSAIAAKRDGEALWEEAWRSLVAGFTAGDVPDYQMAALLMAVAIRGMDDGELVALTSAMIDSGACLDLSRLGALADKHSTGGVGDKVTLVAAPLAAACGVRVAKMSGRGLGHTGGTLDKLESIPGFRTDLDEGEFMEAVESAGIAVIAQRADLVPADKALYALRDVTATVESIPLIAASIVSKKVAAGARAVVFDVKTGSGAFMRDAERSRELGRTLVRLATGFGLEAQAVLTSMDEPLGRAVGNALEVKEAVEVLQGRGPADVLEVALTVGSRMVALGGGREYASARAEVTRALESGAGLEAFRSWVAAQGGDSAVADDPSLLEIAPLHGAVTAARTGVVAAIDAHAVGTAARLAGAGRLTKEDRIDPGVGVVCARKVGEAVQAGEPVLEVVAREDARLERAIQAMEEAVTVSDGPVEAPIVVLEDPLA